MIKKRNLLWLLVPAMAIASVGCTQEPAAGDGNAPSGKIKLTATFENVQDEGATKVNFSTSSGAFSWTEGDEIAVHTSILYWQFATLESGAGSASGVFTAEMNETDRDGYAIYPASVAGGSADAPTITLPSKYTIDGSMGEYSPLPMIAVNAPSTELAFKHVGGIFRITLNKVPEGTKSIVVTMDKQITGTFTVNVSDASKPTITTTGAASSNTVTFNFSTAFAAETDDVVLNVPVPVGLYTSLSVEAYSAVDGGGSHLSGASNDNVRNILRSYGSKVALEIAPNNERIGSFSISDKKVWIGKNGAAGAWTTLTYSAYDMSPTPVAISDATITCIANSNANVEWQVSDGTEIQVRAAANAPAGEVATMTFRMGYCNDYKTATVTVTTIETGATVIDGKFRGFVISPGILKMTASNTFVLTDGTDPFVTLNQYNDSFSASTYPRYYITWNELKTYWGSTGTVDFEVINQTNKPIDTVNSSGTTVSTASWHVPTKANWETIIATTDTSKGAYVNDDTKSNGRKHYTMVYVDLTGSPYAGKGLSARSGTSPDYTYSTSVGSNYIAGVLFFPDDAEVFCENLTTFDTTGNDKFTNDVTYDEIMALVNDGCLFLPYVGLYDAPDMDRGWLSGGTYGYYWTATTDAVVYRTFFVVGMLSVGGTGPSYYLPVCLVQ